MKKQLKREIKGAFFAVAIIFMASIWMWFPTLIHNFQVLVAIQPFYKNYQNYNLEAEQAAISFNTSGGAQYNLQDSDRKLSLTGIAYTAPLKNGAGDLVFFETSQAGGYLYASSPITNKDFVFNQTIFMKSRLNSSIIESIFVVKHLQAGWYYVEYGSD